jgi:hypothetical protein
LGLDEAYHRTRRDKRGIERQHFLDDQAIVHFKKYAIPHLAVIALHEFRGYQRLGSQIKSSKTFSHNTRRILRPRNPNPTKTPTKISGTTPTIGGAFITSFVKVFDVPRTRQTVDATSNISFVKVSNVFGAESGLDLILELGLRGPLE